MPRTYSKATERKPLKHRQLPKPRELEGNKAPLKNNAFETKTIQTTKNQQKTNEKHIPRTIYFAPYSSTGLPYKPSPPQTSRKTQHLQEYRQHQRHPSLQEQSGPEGHPAVKGKVTPATNRSCSICGLFQCRCPFLTHSHVCA